MVLPSFEKIVEISFAAGGKVAATTIVTNPAISAYSTMSWPSLSRQIFSRYSLSTSRCVMVVSAPANCPNTTGMVPNPKLSKSAIATTRQVVGLSLVLIGQSLTAIPLAILLDRPYLLDIMGPSTSRKDGEWLTKASTISNLTHY